MNETWLSTDDEIREIFESASGWLNTDSDTINAITDVFNNHIEATPLDVDRL
jgi:DNA-directed RNA polymerase subunit F